MKNLIKKIANTLFKEGKKLISQNEEEKKKDEVKKKLEKLMKDYFIYIGYSDKEAQKLAKEFIKKHKDRIDSNIRKLMDIL